MEKERVDGRDGLKGWVKGMDERAGRKRCMEGVNGRDGWKGWIKGGRMDGMDG